MSESSLPDGWIRIPLSAAVRPSRPKASPQAMADHTPFVGMEHVEAHTMRLLGTVEARTMRSAGVKFEEGDVLYGRLRPYLNKVYHARFSGLCSAEFIVLPGSPQLDSRFLAYRLNASDFVSFSAQLNEGDRPRVDFAQIGSFQLLLPPVPEQRRIVAALDECLSDLDAAVSGLERARTRTTMYLNSTVQAAIMNELEGGALNEGAGTRFEWKPLAESIADIGQGWSPRCLSEPPSDEEEWGVIKTTAIQPFRFDSSECKALPADLPPRPDIEIRVGDLLVTRKGPRTRAGVAAAVRQTRSRIMICDTVYRIRLKQEMARPHFMAIAMSSSPVAAAIDKAKAGISESGLSLTHDRLGAVLVPYPPLDVQEKIEQEIDRRMEAADRVRADIDLQLARAKRLRQSILQRAFSGGLVSQDPADEPVEKISGMALAKASPHASASSRTRGSKRVVT